MKAVIKKYFIMVNSLTVIILHNKFWDLFRVFINLLTLSYLVSLEGSKFSYQQARDNIRPHHTISECMHTLPFFAA